MGFTVLAVSELIRFTTLEKVTVGLLRVSAFSTSFHRVPFLAMVRKKIDDYFQPPQESLLSCLHRLSLKSDYRVKPNNLDSPQIGLNRSR
jgi:hypothetical protein